MSGGRHTERSSTTHQGTSKVKEHNDDDLHAQCRSRQRGYLPVTKSSNSQNNEKEKTEKGKTRKILREDEQKDGRI